MKHFHVDCDVQIPVSLVVRDDNPPTADSLFKTFGEWDRVFWKDEINAGNYAVAEIVSTECVDPDCPENED